MKNILSHFNHASRRPRRVRRWERARACDIRLQNGVINNAQCETLEDRALLSALSGTYSIGATGNYASLTAAIADIQTKTINGPVVLELQSSYTSTGETFPLTFSNLGTTVVNTLTIRPASGATALSVSSAAAQTVDLNGAQFVTIDGRPGGVGTASQLTIENTSTSGVALRFINEASNNTLKFVTLKGVNSNASSGTVLFSTTTGASGNDNNTIDRCDIRDGATTPANGIYSAGTAAPADNSGNTVSNCNISNFYSGTVDAAGLRLDGGNTDWSITGNSFYQTATRTAVTGNVRAIYVNNASGNNFTVTGNSIGGSVANAGDTAWTTIGTTAGYLLQGILLNVGATTPSSVQGNTIANFVWTSNINATALPGVWSGIYVQAGNVNVGTVTGNTIGSGTGTGSISVTTSGTGGTIFGIASDSSGTVAIANNSIGSITTNGSASTISASLFGISVTAGANTISNNTVGSTTTANSLNAATSSSPTQRVTGIISTSTGSASIMGNTVANLNNNFSGNLPSGQIRGIITTGGVNTITGNTVRNLSTTSRNQNTLMTATFGHSVVGIAAISTTPGQTVSQNIVHSLANTAIASGVHVTGIYFAGPGSGTNLIAGNFVHSLAISTSSSLSVMNGMQFASGRFTAQNNTVRVGLKSDGTSTASASILRGIYDNGESNHRNFYHNSVYVGGTQTSGAANTFAFFNTGGNGTPSTRDFRNNIYVNARSNSGGTGKHYAVEYWKYTSNMNANNNLFFVSGTGGVLGLFDGVDRATLAAWQTALGFGGREANSLNANPLFVNPTGTADTVDLHLQSTSPAIGSAVVLASVTNDFDGDSRTLSPPDIGADELLNAAPTAVVLTPSSASLAENASTSSATELSTITITDDGLGTNTLSLSGADAASFEIVSGKLSLKAGVALDFETKSSYSVRVNVDDTTVGSTPDVFADFTLTVTDVVEDVTRPISSVNALPLYATSLSIPITVTGADTAGTEGPASGVKEYDLYVATSAGTFSKFATVPAASPTAVFTASSNQVYYFRSIARDNAGNEELDNGADAFVRVRDFDKPLTLVTSATANSAGLFTISASGTDPGGGQLARFDIYVSLDGGTPTLVGSANSISNSGTLTYQGLADGLEHTYRFTSRGVDSFANMEDAHTTADVTVTQTISAPVILQATAIDVQLGAKQRSYVRYVDVLFSTAAGVSDLTQPNRVKVEKFGLSATDITAGTGTAVSATVAQVDSSGRLRLDFGTEGLGGARNTNAGDGFYRVRLDANNDGDYNDAGESFEFHRLLGDANGNAIIDPLDTTVVDGLFGRSGINLEGDLNGDGVVNSTDRSFTLSRFRGRKLLDALKGMLDD